MAGYFNGSGSFRARKPPEEVDPMSSMSNVGDIMLVFACGLMVALVVAWNVDLGKVTQVEMSEELDKDKVQEITEQLYGEGNAFVDKGRVYQDPTTGQFYLVQEGEGSGSSGSQGGSESQGDAGGGSGESAGE